MRDSCQKFFEHFKIDFSDIIEFGVEIDTIYPNKEVVKPEWLNLIHSVENNEEVYIRGYLFSVMRQNRVRLTYRWGGEPGDTYSAIPVPGDIEDATMKLVAIDLITTSFRFDIIPRGGGGTLSYDLDKAIIRWKDDVDRIIRNREEIFVVTT